MGFVAFCVACSTGAAHTSNPDISCTANGSHHCNCPVANCEHQRILNGAHAPMIKAIGIGTAFKIGGGTALFTIGIDLVKYVPAGFEIASVLVAGYLAFTWRTLRL